MNEPTQQQTPTAAPTEAPAPAESYEERVARVFGDDADPSAQPADGSEATTAATPPDAPADSAPDKAAEERRARLAQLEADERARVDAQARHREADQIRAKLAEAEKRAKEAEERAKQLVDPTSLNEEGFFEMARRLQVPPQKLGEFLREQMTNPELVAARAATREIDPKLSALEKQVAEQNALIQRFIAEQQSSSVQREEMQAAQEFGAYVAANEVVAPRAAAFLREFGGKEFYQLALSAAAKLPEGAGAQAVLDRVEEDIVANEERAQRLARVYALQGATQQRQAPTPNPAAAKAMTTVSNTLAQQRASVVDEDAEWASLPFEERSARLFR